MPPDAAPPKTTCVQETFVKVIKTDTNIFNNLSFDILAGGETAGIPYATFLADKLNKPMIYIRKKPKGFGINKQIEGNVKKDDNEKIQKP